MPKDNNYLKGAFFISLCWHIVCLSFVNVVITEDAKVPHKFTEVSFLGPILEKTAFEMMMGEAEPRAETIYKAPFMLKAEKDMGVSGPPRETKKNIFTRAENGQPAGAMVKNPTDRSDDPHFFIRDKSIYYHIKEKGLNRFIDGPAAERAVLYKPPMPYFTRKSFYGGGNLVAKFKCVLSEGGGVERVEPVTLSGYPDVDVRCMSYLRQWRFAPREMRDTGKRDWGVVTLNIKFD